MFSRRTAWDTTADPLSEELAQRRLAGHPILDLTAANPTTCGITVDAELMASALAEGATQPYEPQPLGLLPARQSVADYYAESHRCAVDPGRIILAAGTSELYSYAFRLLCDPGDEVLLAQPSYPLFDFLAVLDDVRLRPYQLVYESGWHLDRRGLELAVTERTRAIAVIHPNNPTGHFTTAADRRWVANFCAERQLALVVDEVFLDYSSPECSPADAGSFLAEPLPCLALVMSGLSKVCAMPGMKLAWMVATGPENLVSAATARLEVIADTFLSPGTPVQHALGALLRTRSAVQQHIQARLRANLSALDKRIAGSAVQRLLVEGGWYAILRLPATVPASAFALSLLKDHGVHVHPGEFFGLPSSGFVVISLLAPGSAFQQALELLTSHAARLL